jgi:sugar phosphate isomerase/epimerase
MKLAVALATPEVPVPVPVALFTGDFAQRLDKAAALGYDGVELMPLEPDRIDRAALVQDLRVRRLNVCAIGTGAQFLVDRLTLLAQDRATETRALERFERLAGFAADCGAPLITIGSFRGKLAWGGEGARERLILALRRCAEMAAAQGRRVALEPLNRYESDIVNTAAEGMALADAVAHPAFGLLLDTFHVNVEEASIAGAFQTAAPRLFHVHLGDSNRLAPGWGHYDFALTVRTLQQIGYDGYLSAELLGKPDADAAGRATIEAMRRLVPRR